jgi:hypothetical protein
MRRLLLTIALLLTARVSAAQTLEARLLAIEDRWAEIRYEMRDKSAKLAASRDLIAQAAQIAAENPGKPEPLVWLALALLVEAEIRNNVAALGLAREARRLLEEAEALDPAALGGMIQTTLGMMYYEMPGWPLGFGDKTRAQGYLKRALEIDSASKDNNYFLGDYLVTTGRGREAVPFLEQAAAVPVRAGHERADRGRRADIQESLDKARKAR